MPKTLTDISEAMRDIDFCTMTTHTPGGAIGGRPMSNNRNVEYSGQSRFFTYDDALMVRDIEQDPNVGISYAGSGGIMGLVGKPGIFIHVQGTARLNRDKASFVAHWDKGMDRWFPQGPDTPGVVMIEVTANRLHYWDGEEEGEVPVHGTVT